MFAETVVGHTSIEPKTWNYVVLLHDGSKVAVYLNGNTKPEITGRAKGDNQSNSPGISIGGRDDGFANFEGKIDEVAIYPRRLTATEIARHFRTAGN